MIRAKADDCESRVDWQRKNEERKSINRQLHTIATHASAAINDEEEVVVLSITQLLLWNLIFFDFEAILVLLCFKSRSKRGRYSNLVALTINSVVKLRNNHISGSVEQVDVVAWLIAVNQNVSPILVLLSDRRISRNTDVRDS